MSRHGVKLPARPSGRGALSGARLPQGVTPNEFRAALKKCGGANFARARSRLRRAERTQRLTSYTACMRKHGVNLPPPNFSGKGPLFDTHGVNPRSATYKKATRACLNVLLPARR